MGHRRPWLLGALALIMAWTTPRIVEACSCGDSCYHEFLPTSYARSVPDIPQNGGVVWRVLPYFVEEAANGGVESWISLQRVEPEGLVPLDADVTPLEEGAYLIRPAVETWTEGARYRIAIELPESNRLCGDRHLQAVHEVRVGPPLTGEPTELYASDQRIVPLWVEADGSCDQEITAARRSVSFNSGGGDLFNRYNGSIFTETFVDGEPWTPRESLCVRYEPGATWRGRMSDLVFAQCGGDQGLSEGDHTIQFHLRLPGSDWEYTSETLEFTLECPPDEPADPDSVPDASIHGDGADAGGWEFTGDAGSGDDAGARTGSRGRGGCNVAPTGPGSLWLILLAAFAALLSGRRLSAAPKLRH